MAAIRQLPINNRILIFLAHTNRYAFKSQSRLAHDAGVSKSAVSRLVHGQSIPLVITINRIATALEKVTRQKD